MNVYTRTGDDGTTALFGGERVRKSHARIEAYGTVDESNSAIGMARAALAREGENGPRSAEADALLARIQNELFVLGGDLASPADTKYPVPRIEQDHIDAIERDIDRLTADLAPLKNFVLPGGTAAAAASHLARTVTRRAERLVVDAMDTEGISPMAAIYLNRLSDFLFTLSRWLNHDAGVAEPVWAPVADRTSTD